MAPAPDSSIVETAAGSLPRRLFHYNGGFLTQGRVRRIVQLAGHSLHLGLPGDGDGVAVWGMSPTAHRGEAVSEQRDAPVIRVEDAFLRSLFPGRAGDEPLGLVIDGRGVHFDPRVPSDLEVILRDHPLDDTQLLNRAKGAIARMQEDHLTKYTAFETSAPAPDPGYVLVIDQTFEDASVKASGADRNRFLEMLFVAREEHPNARILIKTHPETAQGFREGYFRDEDLSDTIEFWTDPISPWTLFEGAIAVFTVSSQMGFEAILMGHKPRVFGQPFYAGWGLSADEFPVQRRQRKLTRAQLFAGAMILYPRWYDPYRDALGTLEDALEALAATTRAWRADHRGWIASEMRMWKRKPLQEFFGRHTPMIFAEDPVATLNKPHMVWAGKARPEHGNATRVEDGFLRSRGLGAELVAPLSLVTDDTGIYYDPGQPSGLEALIQARHRLRPDQKLRAQRLQRRLVETQLSKYNVPSRASDLSDLPEGPRILVPGQVEDDASIRLGTDRVATNLALLQATRAANPDAVILYKPHPDVEAGLRDGEIDASQIADRILPNTDPISLLGQVDSVWTMTSTLGFEALVHGVPVTTLGVPFYAGWGLTTDLGDVPPRRRQDISIETLIHAALIDYPRYVDPSTGLPCPVEVIIERLAFGAPTRRSMANRILSKLQGLLASKAHLWRR